MSTVRETKTLLSLFVNCTGQPCGGIDPINYSCPGLDLVVIPTKDIPGSRCMEELGFVICNRYQILWIPLWSRLSA